MKEPFALSVTVPPCAVAPATIGNAVGAGSPVSFVSTPGVPIISDMSLVAEKTSGKASGETFSDPPTRVVFPSMVSKKFKPVASSGPPLVILTS